MPDLTPSIEENAPPPSLPSDLLPIAIAVILFSAGSIWGAITSDGFLEADSLTHYLYARFAVLETHYLVNVWGRPLVTGLYALPAYFCGRMGVRVTSLALAMTCAFVAYAIARGQKYRWPVLALIFTLAQPLVFLHSFSELTELPFAALLGLAFLAYQRRQFFWMTVLIAFSPLARPEGFGFLVLAAIALALHRRWRWIPLLAIPLLAWDFAGWYRYGSPDYPSSLPHALKWLLWLKQEWPYAPDSLYEHGTIFHFLMLMPAVASPFIFPALCIGVWNAINKWIACDNVARVSNQCLCGLLIAVIPLLILAGHSLLYATGKMASSGEMRYMLIVAPFWGLLSAAGWTWMFQRMNWKHHLRWAALAALLPAAVNQRFQIGRVQLGYQVVPLHLNQDMITARRVARLYSQWPLRNEFPMMLASHPGVYYFLDISPTQKLQSREWTKSTIQDAPRGTILIWDPIFGVYNSDAKRSVDQQTIADAGWVPDEIGTDMINNADTPDDQCWTVWLSPQTWSGGESDPQIMTLGQVRLK